MQTGLNVPLAALARAATRPFAILEELNVPCGYERSFKMAPHRLLANRYMLGVNTSDVSREQALGACHRLGMPQDYLAAFSAQLADANLIFLGFENDRRRCVYKVYLEFWDQVRSEVSRGVNPCQPRLLHVGFKWDIHDASRRTIARYTCYPLLDVHDILRRIQTIQAAQDAAIHVAAAEIVRQAARCSPDLALRYMEVEEEESPRVSFDVNLYSAALRMNQVRATLTELSRHFSVSPDEFRRLYSLMGDKFLGHISSGCDRNGECFFTTYYEN